MNQSILLVLTALGLAFAVLDFTGVSAQVERLLDLYRRALYSGVRRAFKPELSRNTWYNFSTLLITVLAIGAIFSISEYILFDTLSVAPSGPMTGLNPVVFLAISSFIAFFVYYLFLVLYMNSIRYFAWWRRRGGLVLKILLIPLAVVVMIPTVIVVYFIVLIYALYAAVFIWVPLKILGSTKGGVLGSVGLLIAATSLFFEFQYSERFSGPAVDRQSIGPPAVSRPKPADSADQTSEDRITVTSRRREQREMFERVGRFPFVSERALTTGDLQRFRCESLREMRNEVFARHGRQFACAEIHNFFKGEPWYQPRYTDVSARLTMIERRNVTLIAEEERVRGCAQRCTPMQ